MSGTGHGPSPDVPRPLPGVDRVAFLRPLATGRANVEIGPFTYHDDPDDPTRFFERNVIHHHDWNGDRLVIGGFCAIAAGVTIVMNGATHPMGGFSTFPFNIFGHGWEAGFDPATWAAESRGDTVIGSDVWIGTEAMLMPGARIGHGAIVAARSVVSAEIPPYAIAAGNPARVVKMRFDAPTVAELLDLAWWDWPVDRITAALDAIRGADLDRLKAFRP